MVVEPSIDPAEPDSARGWLLPAILLALLVAMVLTSVVLWRDRAAAEPVADPPVPAGIAADGSVWGVPAAADPVETARTAARGYYTLDYRHLGADAERLRALTTSGYRARYDTMLDGVRADLVDDQVVTRATPVRDGTATEALTSSSARVLVALEVTTAHPGAASEGSGARPVPMTARVVLRRVGASWLVSDLRELGS